METYNVQHTRRRVPGMPAEQPDKDEEVLLASDDEILHASDSEVFHSSGEEDLQVFMSSGDEKQSPPIRGYRSRKPVGLEILGLPVCTQSHKRLMGVGSSIINRIRAGDAVYTNKNRPSHVRHPTLGYSLEAASKQNVKWPRCLMFLWIIYHSVAEVMPDKFEMPLSQLDASRDEDFQQRYITNFFQNIDQAYASLTTQPSGPGTMHGPRRYLPHGQVIDLFWEYVAFESYHGHQPASLATFARTFNKVYGSKHLRFRECHDYMW